MILLVIPHSSSHLLRTFIDLILQSFRYYLFLNALFQFLCNFRIDFSGLIIIITITTFILIFLLFLFNKIYRRIKNSIFGSLIDVLKIFTVIIMILILIPT